MRSELLNAFMIFSKLKMKLTVTLAILEIFLSCIDEFRKVINLDI